MPYQIVIQPGSSKARAVPLLHGELRIGSDDRCDIRIEALPRYAAKLEFDGNSELCKIHNRREDEKEIILDGRPMKFRDFNFWKSGTTLDLGDGIKMHLEPVGASQAVDPLAAAKGGGKAAASVGQKPVKVKAPKTTAEKDKELIQILMITVTIGILAVFALLLLLPKPPVDLSDSASYASAYAKAQTHEEPAVAVELQAARVAELRKSPERSGPLYRSIRDRLMNRSSYRGQGQFSDATDQEIFDFVSIRSW